MTSVVILHHRAASATSSHLVAYVVLCGLPITAGGLFVGE